MSFYNESRGRDIDPTPVVGVVGADRRPRRRAAGARARTTATRIVAARCTPTPSSAGRSGPASTACAAGTPPAADLDVAAALHDLVRDARRASAWSPACTTAPTAASRSRWPRWPSPAACGFDGRVAGPSSVPALAWFSESASRVVRGRRPRRRRRPRRAGPGRRRPRAAPRRRRRRPPRGRRRLRRRARRRHPRLARRPPAPLARHRPVRPTAVSTRDGKVDARAIGVDTRGAWETDRGERRPDRHACGVFGVYAPGQAVAHLTYLGLYALQHRGQESAGIAVSDGQTITVVEGHGPRHPGVRRAPPRPARRPPRHRPRALLHHRVEHLAQRAAGLPRGRRRRLRARPQRQPHQHRSSSPSSSGMLPGHARPATAGARLHHRLRARRRAHRPRVRRRGRAPTAATSSGRSRTCCPQLEGGFSFVMMDEAHLIGVRDPHGFWPLVLGRVEGGWVLASETAALDIVGAHFVREVEPGEMIVIDATGVHAAALRRGRPEALPVRVRLLRPSRHRCSTARACTRRASAWARSSPRQAPVDADMVMPVPESGIPAAQGYARASRHPLRRRPGEEPLRRPHVHPAEPEAARPGRAAEAQPAAREHPRASGSSWSTTRSCAAPPPRQVVQMLREAGAAEVHFRVSSPPYRGRASTAWTPAAARELLAADMSVGEIRDFLGVDSLAYLELDRLTAATGAVGRRRSAPPASPATTRSRCPLDRLASACSSDDPRRHARRRWRASTVSRLVTRAERSRTRRAAHLRRRRRRHRGRREGGRAHQGARALDVPARGHRRHRRVRRAVRVRRPAASTDPLLVSSTDGVGTKSLIARLTGRYDTIGIDLVAMSVDDIAVQGAEPLFFLDYISIGKLVPEIVDDIVAGVAHGCRAGRAARCSAARCRSTPTSWSPASSTSSASRSASSSARASCPRGVRAGRRRRRLRQPRAALQRLLARAPGAARPRRPPPRRSRVARRAPHARRRAAPPERDLRAGDAEAPRAGRRARVRPHHRRRHPRQPRPGAARRTATPSSHRGTWEEPRIFAEIQAAGDVADDEMAARLQPRPRHAGRRRPGGPLRYPGRRCVRPVTKRGSSERCRRSRAGKYHATEPGAGDPPEWARKLLLCAYGTDPPESPGEDPYRLRGPHGPEPRSRA